jgi:hypothetical protein
MASKHTLLLANPLVKNFSLTYCPDKCSSSSFNVFIARQKLNQYKTLKLLK